MSAAALKRFVAGSVVRIPLGDGLSAFARLRRFPFLTVYDLRADAAKVGVDEIVQAKELFTIAVDVSALNPKKSNWAIIGHEPLEGESAKPIYTFTQSPVDPDSCEIYDEEGNSRRATLAECDGLLLAAVWSPQHVVERIEDHYAGRPNRYLEGPPR